MTCLGLHYNIFDTGGEDADHFTLTFITTGENTINRIKAAHLLCFQITVYFVRRKLNRWAV